MPTSWRSSVPIVSVLLTAAVACASNGDTPLALMFEDTTFHTTCALAGELAGDLDADVSSELDGIARGAYPRERVEARTLEGIDPREAFAFRLPDSGTFCGAAVEDWKLAVRFDPHDEHQAERIEAIIAELRGDGES